MDQPAAWLNAAWQAAGLNPALQARTGLKAALQATTGLNAALQAAAGRFSVSRICEAWAKAPG
jgi:hypothetical protein